MSLCQPVIWSMAAMLHDSVAVVVRTHPYGKPIVAIFNNLIYIQFSIYIYVIFFYSFNLIFIFIYIYLYLFNSIA